MSQPRDSSPPAVPLPPGACDTHAHVFGPLDRFPPSGASSYLPPEAPYERYAEMLASVGAARGVLVQPTFYGTTLTALADALRQSQRSNHRVVRGIGTATSTVSDPELHAMHEVGIRGLRFIEMPVPDGSGRYKGSVGADELPALAPRMRELGWQAQLWCPVEDHAARLPGLVRLGIPIVVDHMGSFTAAQGVTSPAFQRLLGLLSDGLIWVKLSLCRNSRLFPDYDDIRVFHDALVAANPSRLLWGSDWPHVRMGDLAPDVGHLLDLFQAWTGDPAIHKAVLVDNPAILFDFASATEGQHA
jgi:2-pyrone-4,6-dicarboxylate lactonase